MAKTATRNISLLIVAQALGMTCQSLVIVIAALVGYSLADDKSLATLPVALQLTATMLTTFPASLLMRRVGRRAGFTVGVLIGATGGLAAAYAVYRGDFVLFSLAATIIGAQAAFVQFYRFAAAETASEAFRPKAISLVLAGGIAAALAGPELAKWGRDLLTPHLFVGCYLLVTALSLVAAMILQGLDIPKLSAVQRATSGRPLGRIAAQPAFVVAALSGAVGYGVMTLVMTATPLAMTACGFAFDDAAFVIQWHALAMFGPSFFTGSLIQRFGVLNVILAGIALIASAVTVTLSGIAFGQFWGGLVLLGLGWNFMYIGGSTLLTTTCRPEEQAKTQALNDCLIFSTAAAGSFSSGALHSSFGWAAVNLGVIAPLGIAFLAVAWMRLQRRSTAAVAG
ncbi:MFS transporter [Inquilinus sp. CAU 1745]|uniref:MFS transporter n=1 Tax=Inquilinus sp. CAU 1745 TaxID=3140369 RepID=UPI00325AC04C